jgi:hypothetical protein
MKKTLTLIIIVLGCCLFALAQTSGYYQFRVRSSASGYSQDKVYGGSSADPLPPAMSANQSAQKTTVEGCLSQSADGLFMLSDVSGNSYQLNDGTSHLSQFVGKEVRVDGFGLVNRSGPVPGAMSSGSLWPAQQIDVTRVRKIADRCQRRSR